MTDRAKTPENGFGLELTGVHKRFGSVIAVAGVDIAVAEGELLAIVGPSGCGKTTLLRIIAGLEQADTGRVFIQGADVSHLPPERRDVGFVFQQFALFPNMTVAANVEYGLKRKRVPTAERKRRVEEMLAMVGLAELAHRRPDQLSAGQQQRVALARALAPRPKTLLLDEPLSALDAAIRTRLREELRQTQRRLGITTILVTHDQEEALAVADRVAVMNEGRLEQVGTPWELYDRPRTPFVANFVGRGNVLSARVEGERIVLDGLGAVERTALQDAAAWTEGPVSVLVRPEAVVVSVENGDARKTTTVERHAADGFAVDARLVDVTFGGERSLITLALDDATASKVLAAGAAAGRSANGHIPPQAPRGVAADAEERATERLLLATATSAEAQRLVRYVGRRARVFIPVEALRLLTGS